MANLATGLVIKDGEISSAKIKDGAVTTAELADSSIAEAAFKDGSVDSDALASEAVTSTKFATGAVGTDHVQDASVTLEKLAETLFPSNGIIMWTGETIPDGWLLCDGSNGTPDLRDRFVTYSTGAGPGGSDSITVTANDTHTHTGSTSSAGAHTHGGASGGTILSANQIPAHRHMTVTSATNLGGAGTQSPSNSVARGLSYGYDEGYFLSGTYSEPGIGMTGLPAHPTTGQSLSSGQAHSHTVSSDGAHTHGMALSGAEGHTHTVDTRPNYIAVQFIMKA